MRFIDLIPQPHRSWWLAWGLDFDLIETRAVCSSCNMADRGFGGDVRDGEIRAETYDVHLKCCTFFPDIPNFVWSSLAKSVFGRFEKPLEGVLTPRGLQPSIAYRERFDAASFGQRADLLCPFFDRTLNGGGCSIWEHRPSPCVRFVCQSSYGIDGQKVWSLTEQLLGLTEATLSHEVLLRLGFDVAEIASGRWFEFRERDVFTRAGQIVAAMSALEVWELLQPEAGELRDRLCAAAANAIGSRL